MDEMVSSTLTRGKSMNIIKGFWDEFAPCLRRHARLTWKET